MHFNTKLLLTLLATVSSTYAAVNGRCTNRSGICISTDNCKKYGGTYYNGYCPNDPANIKCCDNIPCQSGSSSGKCLFTSQCSTQTASNKCPGGNDFKCCLNGGGGNSTLEKAKKAADYARNHALAKSSGYCAKYIRQALEAAGFSFTRQPRGCDYHRKGTLKNMGFRELKSKPSTFNKGDIIVIDCENNTCATGNNGKCETNHIEIYDGSQWYSDFKQGSNFYTYTKLYNNANSRKRLLSRMHYYRA